MPPKAKAKAKPKAKGASKKAGAKGKKAGKAKKDVDRRPPDRAKEKMFFNPRLPMYPIQRHSNAASGAPPETLPWGLEHPERYDLIAAVENLTLPHDKRLEAFERLVQLQSLREETAVEMTSDVRLMTALLNTLVAGVMEYEAAWSPSLGSTRNFKVWAHEFDKFMTKKQQTVMRIQDALQGITPAESDDEDGKGKKKKGKKGAKDKKKAKPKAKGKAKAKKGAAAKGKEKEAAEAEASTAEAEANPEPSYPPLTNAEKEKISERLKRAIVVKATKAAPHPPKPAEQGIASLYAMWVLTGLASARASRLNLWKHPRVRSAVYKSLKTDEHAHFAAEVALTAEALCLMKRLVGDATVALEVWELPVFRQRLVQLAGDQDGFFEVRAKAIGVLGSISERGSKLRVAMWSDKDHRRALLSCVQDPPTAAVSSGDRRHTLAVRRSVGGALSRGSMSPGMLSPSRRSHMAVRAEPVVPPPPGGARLRASMEMSAAALNALGSLASARANRVGMWADERLRGGLSAWLGYRRGALAEEQDDQAARRVQFEAMGVLSCFCVSWANAWEDNRTHVPLISAMLAGGNLGFQAAKALLRLSSNERNQRRMWSQAEVAQALTAPELEPALQAVAAAILQNLSCDAQVCTAMWSDMQLRAVLPRLLRPVALPLDGGSGSRSASPSSGAGTPRRGAGGSASPAAAAGGQREERQRFLAQQREYAVGIVGNLAADARLRDAIWRDAAVRQALINFDTAEPVEKSGAGGGPRYKQQCTMALRAGIARALMNLTKEEKVRSAMANDDGALRLTLSLAKPVPVASKPLRVTLLRAWGLPQGGSGDDGAIWRPICDCGLAGYGVSVMRAEMPEEAVAEPGCADWDVSCSIEVDYGDALRFDIYNRNAMGELRTLGTACLTSAMVIPNGFYGELPLRSAESDEAVLEVKVDVPSDWDHFLREFAHTERVLPQRLRVALGSARGLPAVACVVVGRVAGQAAPCFQTQPSAAGAPPAWSFVADVPEFCFGDALELDVFMEDGYLLGSAVLAGHQALHQGGGERWVPLGGPGQLDGRTAMLRLEVTTLGPALEAEVAKDALRVHSNAIRSAWRSRRRQSLLELAASGAATPASPEFEEELASASMPPGAGSPRTPGAGTPRTPSQASPPGTPRQATQDIQRRKDAHVAECRVCAAEVIYHLSGDEACRRRLLGVVWGAWRRPLLEALRDFADEPHEDPRVRRLALEVLLRLVMDPKSRTLVLMDEHGRHALIHAAGPEESMDIRSLVLSGICCGLSMPNVRLSLWSDAPARASLVKSIGDADYSAEDLQNALAALASVVADASTREVSRADPLVLGLLLDLVEGQHLDRIPNAVNYGAEALWNLAHHGPNQLPMVQEPRVRAAVAHLMTDESATLESRHHVCDMLRLCDGDPRAREVVIADAEIRNSIATLFQRREDPLKMLVLPTLTQLLLTKSARIELTLDTSLYHALCRCYHDAPSSDVRLQVLSIFRILAKDEEITTWLWQTLEVQELLCAEAQAGKPKPIVNSAVTVLCELAEDYTNQISLWQNTGSRYRLLWAADLETGLPAEIWQYAMRALERLASNPLNHKGMWRESLLRNALLQARTLPPRPQEPWPSPCDVRTHAVSAFRHLSEPVPSDLDTRERREDKERSLVGIWNHKEALDFLLDAATLVHPRDWYARNFAYCALMNISRAAANKAQMWRHDRCRELLLSASVNQQDADASDIRSYSIHTLRSISEATVVKFLVWKDPRARDAMMSSAIADNSQQQSLPPGSGSPRGGRRVFSPSPRTPNLQSQPPVGLAAPRKGAAMLSSAGAQARGVRASPARSVAVSEASTATRSVAASRSRPGSPQSARSDPSLRSERSVGAERGASAARAPKRTFG